MGANGRDDTSGLQREGATPGVSTDRRMRRGVDASAVGTILMSVPTFVYSAIVVTGIGAVFGALTGAETIGAGVVVAIWLLSGALAFHRPTEAFIARKLFHLRPPTERERAKLEAAWVSVTEAAGVDRGKYRLWVEESDAPNASASMGHNVSATTAALHLPPRQLTAVLAHELGHHIGGHAWSGLLMWWYSLPGRVFTRFVVRVVGGVLNALISMFPVIGMFIAGVLFVGLLSLAISALSNTPGVLLLLVVAVLSPLVVPWLARRGELRADRMAIDLGYGRELIGSFDDIAAMHVELERPTLRSRAFASHPTMDARIKKARNYLARTDPTS